MLFRSNDTATTEIYTEENTLSLHDALPIWGLAQSIAAEGEGKIRGFTVSVGFVKTPLALDQIPDQARQRGIAPEEVVKDVMLGRSQIKEMMTPIEVANLYVIGFSFLGKYLVGGDLLFDGGMVKTY